MYDTGFVFWPVIVLTLHIVPHMNFLHFHILPAGNVALHVPVVLCRFRSNVLDASVLPKV
jgi:hypothetical protein